MGEKVSFSLKGCVGKLSVGSTTGLGVLPVLHTEVTAFASMGNPTFYSQKVALTPKHFFFFNNSESLNYVLVVGKKRHFTREATCYDLR